MMNSVYTILIKDDHSFIHTIRKKIMQRSTGIESIRFLVDKMYGNLDATKANVVLEIRTPISHKYRAVKLTPSEELYKEKVEFIFPIDLDCTLEVGNLEFTISFSYLEKDSEGNFVEQVRRIGKTSIEICEDVNWSDYIASSDLDNISQIMMMQQALMEQQKEYAELIAYRKADNIAKDKETNEIYLTANGVEIGDRIKDSDTCTSEDGVPVVDFATIYPEDVDNSVDNVVEF